MDQHYTLDPALLWARDKYLGTGLYKESRELVKRELRRVLRDIVDNLLDETNQEIPILPELLGPKRRIKRILQAKLSRVNALLIPELGGFVMKIKSSLHPFQKRFACAHEIGHTFFFNIEVDPPRRDFQSAKSAYWVEEEFSCFVGREILLPTTSISETIQEKDLLPSVSALRYLSRMYQVSFDVIRLKIINDVHLWDCVIFRSKISEGKVTTIGRNISKGISFRNLRIPRTIDKNSKHSNLFSFLHHASEKGHLKGWVDINREKYSIETVVLNYEQPVLLSILA